MTSLGEYAAYLHALGYTPLPIRTDGSKGPIPKWHEHQDEQPGAEIVARWFQHTTDGIGVVCGASSGHLEMLEVEGRALHLAPQIAALMTDHGAADTWGRVAGGWVEVTPGGGVHWYFRVSDAPALPSRRLAMRLSSGEPEVLIETRGQKGFSVIAPSGGRTHKTGKPWATLTGSPGTCPTITAEERDLLYAVCSMLDERPAPDPITPQRNSVPRADGRKRPGDDYNTRADWRDVLTPHGWTAARRLGKGLAWRRPGKDDAGISATTGQAADGVDRLYVFSTSTELPTEEPLSKFAAYALLEHGGDYARAAKALADAGWGDPLDLAPPDLGPALTIGAAPALAVAPAPVAVPAACSAPLAGDQGAAQPGPPPQTLHAVAGSMALASVHEIASAERVGEHYGPTEDGTARALVQLHGDTLRYCPQRGSWLTWSGARWEWDHAERHRELVRSIARALPSSKEWGQYKRRALSSGGVGGIIRLAQSDARVTVHLAELDARPYELNTPGGIVNLLTGELRPPDPAALHTRSTTAAPDYDRVGEVWERFLSQIFGGNPELMAYVQRLIGLSSIGTVLEQILPFAHGTGANGKSTLYEAIMHVLGRGDTGYAISADSGIIMMRKHQEHPAELAQLSGARLVVCSELDDGQRFAEARIKQLTGRDSVNARFMRQDPFTFVPTHTFALLGNHKPSATVGGPAFWRRVQLVPFDVVIPEAERDARLGERLAQEAPAILAWIARGAAAYVAEGLGTPDVVRAATASYAADEDSVGRFVGEMCHLGPASALSVKSAALRAAYEAWCADAGETPASAKRLATELVTRFGVVQGRTMHARMYAGISLATDADAVDLDERRGLR